MVSFIYLLLLYSNLLISYDQASIDPYKYFIYLNLLQICLVEFDVMFTWAGKQMKPKRVVMEVAANDKRN